MSFIVVFEMRLFNRIRSVVHPAWGVLRWQLALFVCSLSFSMPRSPVSRGLWQWSSVALLDRTDDQRCPRWQFIMLSPSTRMTSCFSAGSIPIIFKLQKLVTAPAMTEGAAGALSLSLSLSPWLWKLIGRWTNATKNNKVHTYVSTRWTVKTFSVALCYF